MNEQPTTPSNDDVEGHQLRSGQNSDDVEGHGRMSGRGLTAETDDVEGHGRFSPRTDPPQPAASDNDDTDDVEGHRIKFKTFADDTDDVEGHAYRSTRDALGGSRPTHPKADDTDDVSGHLSGALGSKKKTEHNAGDDDVEGHAARGRY